MKMCFSMTLKSMKNNANLLKWKWVIALCKLMNFQSFQKNLKNLIITPGLLRYSSRTSKSLSWSVPTKLIKSQVMLKQRKTLMLIGIWTKRRASPKKQRGIEVESHMQEKKLQKCVDKKVELLSNQDSEKEKMLDFY